MKNLYKTLIISLLSISTFAQQASEIDPKFVKLPRYETQTDISNAIPSPTQGMMVYKNSTASSWYYNGSVWTNMTGSLSLPYSQSQAAASTLFSLTNTGSAEAIAGFNSGTGIAARFHINNPANSSQAIYTTTNGSGLALDASNLGTGGAGNFQINNAANTSTAIQVLNLGMGHSGQFQISNATNSNNAINATTNGIGAAGYFQNSNSASTFPTLYSGANGAGLAFFAYTSGTNSAGGFQVTNASNSTNALWTQTNGTGKAFWATNTGTGGAGRFEISNASNIADAVYSSTNGSGSAVRAYNEGTGKAGEFVIQNSSSSAGAIYASANSSGTVISAYMNGLGGAGNFRINNASSPYIGLYSETNGTGTAFSGYTTGTNSAGSFQISNALNTSDALVTTTNGTGRGLLASNTGASGNAAKFNITNASNSSNALEATTTGTGRAAYFQGTNALETNGTIKFGGSGVGTPAASKFLASIDATGTAQWQYLIPYGRTHALSNDALFFIGNSGNATSFVGMPTTAIEGVVNGTTGSLSFIGFAAGVVGKAEGTTLNNGSTTAGIFGYGSSAYNMGVYGYSEESYGVKAYSINGVGFTASSGTKESAIFTNQVNTFPTVKIENISSGNPNALELNGGLKVSGRKTAFKITTSATYISGNKFGILNTTMANASTDILVVTYEYTGGSYLNKQFATYWNGGNWEIHLTDSSAIPVGITFNVLVIKQ